VASVEQLPERAGVSWRPTVSARSLRASGAAWTLTTIAQVAPLLLAAAALLVLSLLVAPLTLVLTVPLALVLAAHAWAIPSLYAARGAAALRREPSRPGPAQVRALGLLGDLLDHDARALQQRSGLVVEPAGLGVWLLAEAGALLVASGGRRVYCYCVRVADPELPAGDRIAHLLLALRADERGFATVANLAFAGAPWRLRRRLPEAYRPALAAALALAKATRRSAPGACG
jgi:hypothetical protein